MEELIAWCGFVGAWLLVFGPLNQAIRELQEEEFEHESVARAAREVDPPHVSAWWLLLPPVYFVLHSRRDQAYKAQIRNAMSPEDLRAFEHLRDVASAWFLVAAGASLIAVKETWELVEAYDWGHWAFGLLIVVMFALSAGLVATRVARPRRV